MTKDAKINRDASRSWFKRFGYQFIRIGLWFGFKLCFFYRSRGARNFPKNGPALICVNHQSHLDPMLAGVPSRRRMNFLAKKQLFAKPPLSWLVHFLDSIPIDREGMSAGGIKETLKRLKRGEMVLMFPEGTRSPDGTLQPILPGFVALVRRVKAPIIPVGIDGAQRAWPKGKKIFRPFRRISVVIGEPIPHEDLEERSDEEILQILESRLRDVVNESIQWNQS
ncbi:MAG: lysophospholipid acyltransferase family protein [Pirellulaceae bacterium]